MKAPPGRRAPAKTKRAASRAALIPLGKDHAIQVVTRDDAAVFHIEGAPGTPGLSLEIVLTPAGPTVRVHAHAVELVADDTLRARCKHLALEASESVAIRAGERAVIDAAAVNIEARTGMVKLRANDDVQLLGEQVLLNCERQAEMPPWAQLPPQSPPPLLARPTSSGDAELLAAIGEGRP